MNESPGESNSVPVWPQVTGRGNYGRGRGRGGGHAPGRGNFNNNYRSPGGFQIFSNSHRDPHGSASSGHSGHTSQNEQSRQDRTSSSNQSVVIKPWSLVKERVLNWDKAV